MNITLISPYPDITSFGLRLISAYLRKNGHKTQIVFLPDPYGDLIQKGSIRYNDAALDEIIPLIKNSDLVGISLMTNFFDSAVEITEKIKQKLEVPVLWGGVHATIRPEESLKFADMVCIGDGEESILELADKMEKGEDYTGINNLWIRSNGKIIKNKLRPLIQDLDAFPIPDYSNADHYILFENHVIPLTLELTKIFLKNGTVSAHLDKIGYQTMTGRGCPHKCTYCINDTIKNLYAGQRYLRWRSTDHVMKELLWVKEHMPFVGFIWISDDAFFARNTKEIKAFCKEYKEKIDLPFSCLASPLTISEEKMEHLVNAGLVYVQMGLESGSAKIQAIFNRKNMNNKKMMEAIHILNKYKHRMFPPSYDFILDTPYEDDNDKIETLKFISEIPKPYKLQPFSLVLSPGTKLFDMIQKDGYIKDEKQEMYLKTWAMREHNYFNLLMTISKNGNVPSFLLKLLISKPATMILNNQLTKPILNWMYDFLKTVYSMSKGFLKID